MSAGTTDEWLGTARRAHLGRDTDSQYFDIGFLP